MLLRRSLLILTLLGLGAGTAAHVTRGPVPARLVTASVTIDGALVLQGSTSDDGHPDADAVWGYLVGLELEPREGFAALGLADDATEATFGWLRGVKTEHLGDPPSIELAIAYGGTSTPVILKLVRTAGADTWRVAPETVERQFPYRLISRRQAAELEDPKRKR